MGVQWPNCDVQLRDYVNSFVQLLVTNIGNALTGIYLHGSLATGSYFPPKSDIDIVAVVENSLPTGLLSELGVRIAESANGRPTIGSIEFSIITRDAAWNIPDPIPYELHYSTSWHERLLRNEVDYAETRCDSDLFAHLLCIRNRGMCLYGESIETVFAKVPWGKFMFAVLDDLDWIMAEENNVESPYYGILNICRVVQLLVEKTEYTYSKLEGGMWALQHLPERYLPLIRKALDVYSSDTPLSEAERKCGGVEWDKAALLQFRDYVQTEYLQ